MRLIADKFFLDQCTYCTDSAGVGGIFRKDSKVEDLFCGVSSGSEPSVFFSNDFFGLSLSLFKTTSV